MRSTEGFTSLPPPLPFFFNSVVLGIEAGGFLCAKQMLYHRTMASRTALAFLFCIQILFWLSGYSHAQIYLPYASLGALHETMYASTNPPTKQLVKQTKSNKKKHFT